MVAVLAPEGVGWAGDALPSIVGPSNAGGAMPLAAIGIAGGPQRRRLRSAPGRPAEIGRA